MRLINTDTLVLEQFLPQVVPKYAILSHTWGPEEVTFREYQAGQGTAKAGYRKIVAAAAETKRLQLAYLWVDTCCIDKNDSTELTENINSMFQYYRGAQVCLAFLADVRADDPDDALFRSRWFTRGWTLQELVAPRALLFYDGAWAPRRSKARHIAALAARTRIPPRVLLGRASPADFSVARRMAWAAGRATERIEDAAYCLLGIFDVHMPLLYGEGTNAFRRLQEEIVKRSIDLTIFAWNLPRPGGAAATAAAAAVAMGHSVAATSSTPQARMPSDPPTALPAADERGGFPAPFQLPPLPVLPSLPTFSPSSSLSLATEVTEAATDATETSTDSAHMLPASFPTCRRRRGHHIHDHNDLDRRRARPEHCLFATSPALFAQFADLQPYLEDFENFTVTNRGLSMSGSVSLRMAERPVNGGNGATETIYMMLLGHQKGGGSGNEDATDAAPEMLVALPLLMVGPGVFQRDWASDLVVVTEAESQRMRGVQATDWYILIDRREANMAPPELYRQAALHVPAAAGRGEGGPGDAVGLAMQAVSPAHLWDAHDRVFLRPRPYGWVRYDMVLVLQYGVVGVGAGGGGSLVVLCHYRVPTEPPAFFVFDTAAHPRETALLLMPRSPQNCLTWPELNVMCPALRRLGSSVVLTVGGGDGGGGSDSTGANRVHVRAAAVETKIDLGYAEVDVHSLTLEVTRAQ